MATLVWQDGRILGDGEASVNATSHGYTVGDGAFETLGVRGGVPFALTRHLNRLERSLFRLGLGEVDRSLVTDGIAAVLEAGGGEVGRVRVTVSAGAGPLGSARPDSPLTVTVAGGGAVRSLTCSVARAPWRRNEFSPVAGIKSISSVENVMLLKFAKEHGADEAWVQNTQGMLCEGSGSNAFVEIGGEILTPPLSSGCLAGITRGLALEWGAKAGIPIREATDGELPWEVLDEVVSGEASAASTSATRWVQPVARLDGTDAVQGVLIAALAVAFEQAADANPDPR